MLAFSPGDRVYALNPKYRDGTRLRAEPKEGAAFNGVWVPNDTALDVVRIAGVGAHGAHGAQGTDGADGADFVEVRKHSGETGWIRARNLTRTVRVAGITKDVVTTEMVTPDPEYVAGIKIYNLGIKDDPAGPGSKFGKGVQHLISSQWLNAISEFVAAHTKELAAYAQHALDGSKSTGGAGYDYVYFTNAASHLFHRADALGLKTQEARDFFLMATWLTMAAAEVDDFPFRKYTPAERAKQRDDFYRRTLAAPTVADLVAHDDASVLGAFAAPASRRDLLPPIAMERLGINNELSSLKYKDAEQPLREGFLISKRIDSIKRHFEGVHRRLDDEDHITHLLWNFHAVFHVLVVFPEKNDLIDYSASQPSRPKVAPYEPTTSLEKIVKSGADAAAHALKLDWNEGTIAPPPSVTNAIVSFVRARDGAHLKWYPELAGGVNLREELARYCSASVIPENIVVTNGSDDALILLCHAYLQRGTTALVPVPTYEHFCANVSACGANLVRFAMRDPFAADVDEITTGIERHKPRVVYLVSPNNPTGVEWPVDAVRGLSSRFPETLFIVDEAYFEFGTSTCVQLAIERRNVVVTRTFSKAFCLAAVRCGYLVAHPTTVEELRAFYNPKSVNQLAQVAALAALKEFDAYYRPYIAQTNAARDTFVTTMRARGVDVRSGGGGNFVCVRVDDKTAGPSGMGGRTPADLCKRLEQQGIYVRDISGRFPGWVRITVAPDMQRVVDALT